MVVPATSICPTVTAAGGCVSAERTSDVGK